MAGEHELADSPVDRAIARISFVYRGWTRYTPVAQMRRDWDAAFGTNVASVACERVMARGVDAEWLTPRDVSGGRVILYFHGGGFRMGSVTSHRDLIARLAEASQCAVLAINYRLAPEHRFPAALDDALQAYAFLLDQGLKPDGIALAGDSSGGNLALAAMLALRDRGQKLPAAAVLMSPWTDLAATGASYQSRAEADPIHQRKMILALAKDYLGEVGDPRNPLASPLYAELAGLPPLLIQVGDRETVRDDSVMFAQKAQSAGVDVMLEIFAGMIHVFQMFPEIPQARDAIASAADFLRKHLDIRAGEAAP